MTRKNPTDLLVRSDDAVDELMRDIAGWRQEGRYPADSLPNPPRTFVSTLLESSLEALNPVPDHLKTKVESRTVFRHGLDYSLVFVLHAGVVSVRPELNIRGGYGPEYPHYSARFTGRGIDPLDLDDMINICTNKVTSGRWAGVNMTERLGGKDLPARWMFEFTLHDVFDRWVGRRF